MNEGNHAGLELMMKKDLDSLIARFARSLLTLAPDFSMDAEEIQARIDRYGVDSFIRSAGGHAATLAEVMEILESTRERGRDEKT